MITVSTFPRPELILTWVGKVAPPMPTTPAFWSTFTSSSAPRSAPRSGGLQSGQGVSLKSFSMTTLITGTPLKCILGSTAATVPDTLAWTAADTAAVASPTFCPTVTWSPTATQGWQGAPMCMDMGTTTRAGGGQLLNWLLARGILLIQGMDAAEKGLRHFLHLFFSPTGRQADSPKIYKLYDTPIFLHCPAEFQIL